LNSGFPGILYFATIFLVKDLDVSNCAKTFFGPNEGILISSNKSTTPASKGASGATTANSGLTFQRILLLILNHHTFLHRILHCVQ